MLSSWAVGRGESCSTATIVGADERPGQAGHGIARRGCAVADLAGVDG
jgi:hypothetical protein